MKPTLSFLLVLIFSIHFFGQDKCPSSSRPRNRPLEIVFKPPPSFPKDVQANIQGSVVLKVEFLAKGGIGRTSVIKGLPYGLTEEAIKAAKGIKFKPEIKNCEAVNSSRPVTFSFSIY